MAQTKKESLKNRVRQKARFTAIYLMIAVLIPLDVMNHKLKSPKGKWL